VQVRYLPVLEFAYASLYISQHPNAWDTYHRKI